MSADDGGASRRDETRPLVLRPVVGAWRRRMWLVREVLTFAGLLVAGWLAFQLRFEFAVPDAWREVVGPAVVTLALAQYLALAFRSVHRRAWRYTGLSDGLAIALALATSLAVLTLVRLLPLPPDLRELVSIVVRVPWSVLILSHVLALLAVSVLRLGRRSISDARRPTSRRRSVPAAQRPSRQHRALIVGCGRSADLLLRELSSFEEAPLPVGILCDDPSLDGQLIAGVRVLGRVSDLNRVARDVEASMLVLAIDRAAPETIRAIVVRAQRIGLIVRIRATSAFSNAQFDEQLLRPIALRDLLNRQTVRLDVDRIEEQVRGRVVLVTGAGGSIGAELARQLLRYRPARLVLLDRSEVALWAIERELSASLTDTAVITAALVDIADRDALRRVLRDHPPAVIFHAAALKHVPLLESNVAPAIANNVFGTRTLVEEAIDIGVSRFVLISSDKAVEPSSVMGATKRVAELIVSCAAQRTGRDFVSVRFGNVLGSSGSVVPVFEQQIAEGGPVTITDLRMTRYFMTIREACGLVLQAAVMGGAGAIQVLDMGEPVLVADLARDLIRLQGLEPGVDIELREIGLRPGEKLHEALAFDAEDLEPSEHPSVLIARPYVPADLALDAALAALELQLADQDERDLRASLFAIATAASAATPTVAPSALGQPHSVAGAAS